MKIVLILALAMSGCAIFRPAPNAQRYTYYPSGYYVRPFYPYSHLQAEQNEQTDRLIREDMRRTNTRSYEPRVVMPTYTTPQIPVLPTDSCGAACEPVTVPRETLPQQNFYQSQPTQSQSDEQAIVCANSPPGTPGCQE